MVNRKERSEYAAALGQRGGQTRAKNLSPEERTESARNAAKARWNDASAVLTVKDTIRGVENGTVDLEKARVVEGIAKNLNQLAALTHEATQLGIDPGLFTQNVTRKQVRRWKELVKQMTSAIRRSERSKQ
jgi:hypothetical protein